MKIEAIIVEYLPGDLHFDYDDGSFEWFDGIVLRVIAPEYLYHKEIYVFHDEESSEESHWKDMGLVVEFEYKSFDDFETNHVFTTGLKNVKFKI